MLHQSLIILIVITLSLLYFVPCMIAISKSHPDTGKIVALDILLGWTIAGWIAALVWSLSYRKITNSYDQKLERLNKLKLMLDNGVLSEEEFKKEKANVLAD